MIIRQEILFSFEELQKCEPKSRIEILMDKLDVTPCVQKLPVHTLGRRPYPHAAMLRALVAMHLLSIPTVSALVERLSYDLRLLHACGFDAAHRAPSNAKFSRFYEMISKNDGLHRLFDALVQTCRDLGIVDGKNIAIDSSALHAYEHPLPQSKHPKDGQQADWGHKNDSHGKPMDWYGYKLHAAVDAKSGLPLAVRVTPANEPDVCLAIPLMEKAASSGTSHYCMDKGYDATDIYRKALELGGSAIIPLNLRNEKIPPEGLNRGHAPVCSMGYDMIYWGCDRNTGVLKFRCPHVLGKVDCPQGSNWCSESNYGCVVKKRTEDDPRSFCLPHRGSREWERIYKLRSASERLFSRTKAALGLDDIHLRGIAKVTAHSLLCCITVLASAVALHG